MAWAGHTAVAYAMYVPLAVVGVLLPHLAVRNVQPRWLLAGHAAFCGLLSELLTRNGLGCSYSFAVWGMCAAVAFLFMPQVW